MDDIDTILVDREAVVASFQRVGPRLPINSTDDSFAVLLTVNADVAAFYSDAVCKMSGKRTVDTHRSGGVFFLDTSQIEGKRTLDSLCIYIAKSIGHLDINGTVG